MACAQDGLRVTDPRCEGQREPLGVDEARPLLSWKVESPRRGARQTAWQVQVAGDAQALRAERPDVWDSGRVDSAETVQIPYGGPGLATGRQVKWRVRVWDEAGRPGAWSEPASWTQGVMAAADWRGRWITGRWTNGLPVFRREFDVRRTLRRALVQVSGLGHYELFLDGSRVGDRFLDPAWTDYARRVGYATHDITGVLRREGRHAFGVMLGKGFYRTRGDRRVHGVNSEGELKLVLQAKLEYADGTEDWVVSDDTWRCTEGPITHSAILGGEDHDARRLARGWGQPGFDDSGWWRAEATRPPAGRLVTMASPPMTVREVLDRPAVDSPAPGIWVYDFQQNASAIPRLTVRGKAGQKVRLTPAEQRHGMTPRRNDGRGRVNPAGVGRPCYFEYTLRGEGEETWAPQFTYSGFQYLEVEGAVPEGQANPQGLPVVANLASLHVRSAADEVGSFACSDPLLNQIDRGITWAVRANLAHVLTDCPHREKLGWLEVAYLMGPSIAGRQDLSGLYAKIATDCADAQSEDGRVPTVAPAYPAFEGGFAYTPEWGAAAVLVPELVHTWYGDRRTLERSYPAMCGFVDYMARTAKDLVPVAGLGDWYDYGHGQPVGASRFTPPELSAMATFHRCAVAVARAARELGRNDDAQRYGDLADAVAAAFERRWWDSERKEYRNQGSPQTAHAMALVSGLVPESRRGLVLEAIVTDLQRRNLQQTAGDIGYAYLLEALGAAGRSDLIHAIVTRTNLGSYGFIVRNGWTAMPEAWDADTGASMNHCMLGHIQAWFLGRLAGIRPEVEGAGFRRLIVAPEPVGDLRWAEGGLETVRGRVSARWERDGDRLELRVRIPANTEARIRVPAGAGSRILESGRRVAEADGVEVLERDLVGVWMRVGGGEYRFEVQ